MQVFTESGEVVEALTGRAIALALTRRAATARLPTIAPMSRAMVTSSRVVAAHDRKGRGRKGRQLGTLSEEHSLRRLK